jgi:hypothetical protein
MKRVTFQIPSRLNSHFQQVSELLLNIVAKCIEEGAADLVESKSMDLNEVGDGTAVELKYDERFGDLEENLKALTSRTARELTDLLPSVFAIGFKKMEPRYIAILQKRVVNSFIAGSTEPPQSSDDPSTRRN